MLEKIKKLMAGDRIGHVLYKVVNEILKEFPNKDTYVLESGVTPSGKIHIGNFNDMVITFAVSQILEFKGYNTMPILVFDSRDPFRKAPVFAPDEFKRKEQEFFGKPLDEIEDPWGCHENFAEHFIVLFLESLEDYGIRLIVYRAKEVHSNPIYIDNLIKVLKNREKVREILNDVRSKAGHKNLYPKNWIPYRPKCENCGRMDERVIPLEVSEDGRYVRYKCLHCGHEGVADVTKMQGKPPWRIDWPLRWVTFKVNFEPMGKDHMAAGSSYHTARALLEQFFKVKPPVSLFYDFVYWIPPEDVERKTKLAFSGRKGIGWSTSEWLRYAPPEVLKYLILRRQVADIRRESLKHIDFSPLDVPSYVDAYDKHEMSFYDYMEGKLKLDPADEDRLVVTYVLSQVDWKKIRRKRPFRVPYDDMIEVALWMESIEEGIKMLRRMKKLPPNIPKEYLEDAKRRLIMVSNWVHDYYKPQLPNISEILEKLDEKQKEALKILIPKFLEIPINELTMDKIRESVKGVADDLGLSTRDIYKAFYIAVLGKESGPPVVRLFRKEFSRKHLEKLIEFL